MTEPWCAQAATDDLGAESLLPGVRDGVATRKQLLRHGISDARIRWMVSRRRWRLLLPGVVLLAAEAPTRRQQLIAAHAHCGDESRIGGAAAARFHGVRSIPAAGVVHVIVGHEKKRRVTSFVDVRPSRIEDPFSVVSAHLALTSPERSVVDAARWAPTQLQASALVIEAVQREIVTTEGVGQCLAMMGRQFSAQARLAIAEAERGAWSLPEAELLTLMRTSRVLSPAWPNPILTDARGMPLLTPDAWFYDVGMAVMVHSQAFHDGGEQWDVTVSRDGELTSLGILVAGVTPHAIRSRPARVLDRLERTYRSAQRRERPPVIATPRQRQLWRPTG